jgi:hypothetical protein
MEYRRVVVSRHGGPGALQVIEEVIPEPKDGEVRIRVLAAWVFVFGLRGWMLLERGGHAGKVVLVTKAEFG